MRLSITLEDDLYGVAKSLAKAEDCSLSAAVNRLIRRALESPTPASETHPLSTFPVSRGARVITPDDVAALDDDA